ncbi:MAG: ribokinase [Burkholderiales bacterium]|nr:ribokinase [Burkholderiales bacterium]MDE2628620.1 ribokinase [Burkholderiales bacterium]
MSASEQPLIAVFGSVNIDVTAWCDRLPRPGETVSGRAYSMSLGGKGANQAVAVARLGLRSVLIGRTGADDFGRLARDRLTALGVGLDHLHSSPDLASGVAVISVDAQAENCIVVIGGANLAVDATLAQQAAQPLRAARVLLLQLEVPLPAALAAAGLTRAAGGLVILDPAPAPAGGLPDEALHGVDVVTPNETETEAIVGVRPTGPTEAAQAAARLIARGVPTAVIKMGAAGVYFRGPNGEGFVAPFPVHAVNSVGAGDSFNGGLAAALARGASMADAVRFAAACGALATTGPGGAASAPTLAAVEALLR